MIITHPSGSLLHADSQSRTLRKRYKEYVRDCRIGAKRPKFENLFNLWPNDLDFFFAPIEDDTCNLKEIEEALNNSVIPHCVTDDFSAEIRRIVPVLRG